MKRKIIYWLPRIICILTILFISMFAMDVFDGKASLGEKLIALIIHLIPSFILLALTIIAWKWEAVGGVLLIVISVMAGIWLFSHNYAMNHSVGMTISIVAMMALPFMIAGLLFIWSAALGNQPDNPAGTRGS